MAGKWLSLAPVVPSCRQGGGVSAAVASIQPKRTVVGPSLWRGGCLATLPLGSASLGEPQGGTDLQAVLLSLALFHASATYPSGASVSGAGVRVWPVRAVAFPGFLGTRIAPALTHH
jgi:hypothetical protein